MAMGKVKWIELIIVLLAFALIWYALVHACGLIYYFGLSRDFLGFKC